MFCLHFRFRLLWAWKWKWENICQHICSHSPLLWSKQRQEIGLLWFGVCTFVPSERFIILLLLLALSTLCLLPTPVPVSLDLEVCSNSTWYYRTTSTLHQNKARLRVSAIYYDPVHLFLWVLVTMNNNVMIMRTWTGQSQSQSLCLWFVVVV